MNETRAALTDGRTSLKLDLTRKSRVLILGGYGVRNMGDEAILAGLLSQLPDVHSVRVVSRSPGETRIVHRVEGVSLRNAALALFRSDALIVGGGGLFSSNTGPFGRYIPLFCRLALLRGISVAFHGVGIYPSTSPKLLESVTALAPKLRSFTVRDSVSADLMRSLDVNVEQIPDLAESMPLANEGVGRALLRSIGIRGDRPVVGLCLTGVRNEVAVQLLTAVPELIDARPDVDFCFIPISQHPTNPRHNDTTFARELQARAPRMFILDGAHHPADIQAVFGQLSAAVCVRFHSYVFTHRAGVPLIGIPYAEKCQSWLEEHEMEAVDLSQQSLTVSVSRALSQPSRQALTV